MRHLLLIVGVLLLGIGCHTGWYLQKPFVAWAVKDEGGTLELTWPVEKCVDGYRVYYDGHTEPDTTLKIGRILITAPKKSIKVEVYTGAECNDSMIDVSAASTVTTISVHGLSMLGTDNAFGFNPATGMASPSDVSNGTSSSADFVMEDRSPYAMSFWSPTSYDPPVNRKDNASIQAMGVAELNELKSAPAPGKYSTKMQIEQGGVYSLWIDSTGDGYSLDDHFAKVQVISLSGSAVALKAAYQKIPGLRWFVTE